MRLRTLLLCGSETSSRQFPLMQQLLLLSFSRPKPSTACCDSRVFGVRFFVPPRILALPSAILKRILTMSKLFIIGALAFTLAFATTEPASASRRGRCCVSACHVAPPCCAPVNPVPTTQPAADASAGKTDSAVIAPSTTAQANSGTYRSFSFDPSVPATGNLTNNAAPVYRSQPAYRTPRSQTPLYLIPKGDSHRYSGY